AAAEDLDPAQAAARHGRDRRDGVPARQDEELQEQRRVLRLDEALRPRRRHSRARTSYRERVIPADAGITGSETGTPRTAGRFPVCRRQLRSRRNLAIETSPVPGAAGGSISAAMSTKPRITAISRGVRLRPSRWPGSAPWRSSQLATSSSPC